MNTFRIALVPVLLLLWAILPWPSVRWAAILTALFFSLGALWSLVLSRFLVPRAEDPVLRSFSGRRVEVRTLVENRSFLPSGKIFVADPPGGVEVWGETRSYLQVRPLTRLPLSYSVRGRERGQRSLGPLTVSGCDPTGFFPFLSSGPPRSFIVYPPLKGIRNWPSDGIPSGARKWDQALADDVSQFRTYRDFEPGDSLSRLSAAAWARTGVPQVRTYDRTVARPSGVVVDLRAGLYPLKLRWALVEEAVEMAASLVWESLGRGESVWLTVIDAAGDGFLGTLGPGRGWGDARPFLERLALAVPDPREGLPVWPDALVLPPAPLRLLWVAPPLPPWTGPRGYDIVRFTVEEGSAHGLVHP